MITIDLDPSVHLGPFALAWHGIFTAVAIFAGVALATRLASERAEEADITAVATWGVVGGIIGARLFHVFDCWTGCTGIPGGYSENPWLIPQIWTGGIAVWGGALGGAIAGLFVAWRRRPDLVWFGADAAAPALALGFAVGRIGDVINGEHHAVTCQAPLGICVEYTNPATLGQSPSFPPSDPRYAAGPVHLAVGYDMVWNLISVWWLLALRGRGLPDGLLFWLWLAWYAIGRIGLGVLRVGEPTYAFGLREDQAIGVLVLAAAVPMIVRLWPRARSTAVAA